MNPGFRRSLLLASLLAAGPLSAEPPTPDDTTARPDRRELTRLVREDAGRLPAPTHASPAPSGSDTPTEMVVALAPLVVEERIPPLPEPVRETKVKEFFRTGVLAEKVGRKVTTRFWVKGDRGIMLSFRW